MEWSESSWGSRYVAHWDVNYFYAQIEVMRNPKLRGYRVAVGGDVEARHGIILAATPEAKKFGVKTGMTLNEAKALCPYLIILPPDFDYYMQVSGDFKSILADYTDLTEDFGLDESWGDLTHTWKLFAKSPLELCEIIRHRVLNELGLTISTGLSYNKIFAKLGSDYKKPFGLTIITPQNFKDIVWRLPAQDLLYVGRETQVKLNSRGIRTIGDIARTSPKNLQAWLKSKVGLYLSVFANGEDHSPVSPNHEDAGIKSIGNSWTTPRDIKNETDCRIVFQGLADSVSTRMRELGFMCRTVQIDLRDTFLVSKQRQFTFETPTFISSELCDYAMMLLGKHHDWNRSLRSIGIRGLNLTPPNTSYQFSLFENPEKRQKLEDLEYVKDEIREVYGTNAIMTGLQLSDPQLSQLDAIKHVIHPVGYL